jgi:hypothetical protein
MAETYEKADDYTMKVTKMEEVSKNVSIAYLKESIAAVDAKYDTLIAEKESLIAQCNSEKEYYQKQLDEAIKLGIKE